MTLNAGRQHCVCMHRCTSAADSSGCLPCRHLLLCLGVPSTVPAVKAVLNAVLEHDMW